MRPSILPLLSTLLLFTCTTTATPNPAPTPHAQLSSTQPSRRDNSDNCPGIVVAKLLNDYCCVGGATISGHPELEPTGCATRVPLTADNYNSLVSEASAKITTWSQSATAMTTTKDAGKTSVMAPGVTFVADGGAGIVRAGMLGAVVVAGAAMI